MFCRHCGNEVKNKAVVCSGCGNPIDDASSSSMGSGGRWSWFTMFVTIGVFILLLLIAIIAGL